MSFKIVSFYTQKTPYEHDAKKLKRNLQERGIAHEIIGIPSQGSWEENCAYKPQFLLEMWRAHQGPLVWLDVDAKVFAYPTLFDTLDCDLALRINHNLGQDHRSYLMSGTLFIHNKKILEKWALLCQKNPEIWDQVHLKHCLMGQVVGLPFRYAHVIGEPCQDPIITHFIASNFFKNHLNCQDPINSEACDFVSRLNTEGVSEEGAEMLNYWANGFKKNRA